MRSHSFLLAIFSVVCKLLVAVEQPTITLKEGLPAEIPCMVKGVADAYFWRRGEHLNISDEIATIVFGVPGVVSDAFRVTEDGTLMIYNVTSAIEDRYFCRISTKDNAYFSDVMVLVQVLFEDFGFGIEQCYPKETCTLQVEPHTTTNVTCTATGVPSSFSLKWYNGSEVITSVSSEHSSNNVSTTISETITMSSDFGLPLTCKAVDMENGQTCGRFAHVRLNKTDKATQHTDADKSSARWIVPLVLLTVVSGFTILLLIFIYVRIKRDKENTKSPSNNEEEEVGLIGTGNAPREPKDKELTELQDKLKRKDEEFRELQVKFAPKDKEITELQDKLKLKDEEFRALQVKFAAKDSENKTLQSQLKDTKEMLEPKDKELTELQDKLKAKDSENKTLQSQLKETKKMFEVNDQPENLSWEAGSTAANDQPESRYEEAVSTAVNDQPENQSWEAGSTAVNDQPESRYGEAVNDQPENQSWEAGSTAVNDQPENPPLETGTQRSTIKQKIRYLQQVVQWAVEK